MNANENMKFISCVTEDISLICSDHYSKEDLTKASVIVYLGRYIAVNRLN